MKKIFFSTLLLTLPLLIFSQKTWTNGTGNNNWSDNGNWSGGDFPNGNGQVVQLGATAGTINLTEDITVKLIKGTNGGAGNTFTISGDYTLTIANSGNTSAYSIQTNGADQVIVFDCDVNLNDPNNDANVVRANKTGVVTFNAGRTLTLTSAGGGSEGLKTFGAASQTMTVNINGTLVAASGRALEVSQNSSIVFGSAYSGDNFSSSLLVGVDNNTGASVTVNGSVKAANFFVYNNSLATIGTTGSLNVTGQLTTTDSDVGGVSKTGRITIETSRTASGSLHAPSATFRDHNSDGDNDPTRLTFKRPIDNFPEWSLVGFPGKNEAFVDIDTNLKVSTSGSSSGDTSFGVWSPLTAAYDYYDTGTNSATLLNEGQGYVVSPNGATTLSADVDYENQNKSYNLVDGGTGALQEWNLVSNPHPAYLNLNDNSGDTTNNFLKVNASALATVAVYAWDGSAWDVFDQTTNTINYIAPGEGFFVKAVDGAGTDLSFTQDMMAFGKGVNFNDSKVNDPYRNAIFKIELQDLDNNKSDYTKLFFTDKATKGLDPGYDSEKFFMGPNSKIFTRLLQNDKGVNYHNQSLPMQDLKDAVVPLGINSNASSMNLKIKENTIDHLYNVFLEDRLKNTIVEFDEDIALELDKNSDNTIRFYLHFTDGMIPELPTDGDDFRIFKVSNDEIKLMGSPETNYNAKVYDFSGRLVREISFTHKVNINEIDSKGINILTIESDDKKFTKKFKLN